MNKYLFTLICFLFFISNCAHFKNIKKNNFFLEKQQLFSLNIKNSIEKIILEILSKKDIFLSEKISLYISSLKNESNIVLENKEIINIVKKIISKNKKKINIVDKKLINKTKEKLGLSKDNNVLSINEAILVSRNNNTTHYLNISITENSNFFSLKIQLILVKTGEIIFCKIQKIH